MKLFSAFRAWCFRRERACGGLNAQCSMLRRQLADAERVLREVQKLGRGGYRDVAPPGYEPPLDDPGFHAWAYFQRGPMGAIGRTGNEQETA